jgi:glutamate racemase
MNLLVFDSGIGGLGVVREIRLLQPEANLIYLADNGFYPYGEKPDAELIARILKIIGAAVEFFQPDAVVIACNTASTVALAHLREAIALPFIGCVPPIKPAAAASVTCHIGLLATAATIRRPYLADLVRKFAGDCTLHSHGTAILADLAEAKFRGQTLNLAELQAAIAPLLTQQGAELIDAVALGCTHYTFLLPELLRLHPELKWFDPAGAVARQTAAVTSQLPGTTPSPHTNTAFFTAARPDAAIVDAGLRAYGFVQSSQLQFPVRLA